MAEPFIPTRADRWKALALLGLWAGLILGMLYLPLLKPWWLAESQLRTLRAKIAEGQRLQQDAAGIDAGLVELRARLLENGNYLPEPTAALANAGMAQRIQQAVDGASSEDSVCVLGNRTPIQSGQDGDECREVRFSIDMQCGTHAMQGVLHALEEQPPRLHVDRMTIGQAPNPLGFDKPAPRSLPLNISLEIAGCLIPTPLALGDAAAWG